MTRKTASQYLKQLVEKAYLKLLKIGRSNFYLNDPLFYLLSEPDTVETDDPMLL